MILDLRIRGNKKHKGIVCPKELKNIAEEIPLGCKAFYFFFISVKEATIWNCIFYYSISCLHNGRGQSSAYLHLIFSLSNLLKNIAVGHVDHSQRHSGSVMYVFR